MRVKIYKRNYREEYGVWLPYIIINCINVDEKEYAKMHAESEYANCKYEILAD